MSDRIDKINQALRKEIGSIIQFDLKDPRLKFVTITHVEVSRDLQHARVFFSVLGDSDKVLKVQQGLASAGGMVRRFIGQRVRMRYTPELNFIFDDSTEESFRIEKTLQELKSESNSFDQKEQL